MSIVYLHTNMLTGRSYVGVSVGDSWKNRWKQHVRAVERGSPLRFHRSMRKHGQTCWMHTILETGLTNAESLAAEKMWIKELDTRRNGYNLTDGGEGTAGHRASHAVLQRRAQVWVGRKHSESTKAKIRDAVRAQMTPERRAAIATAHIGKHPTEATRLKMGAAHKGMKRSPEAIEKTRAALIGIKRSPETRAKVSAAVKAAMTPERREAIGASKRGKPAPSKGCKRSEESCRRMSESQKRRAAEHPRGPMSEETKRKLSQARMGHTVSEETKCKMAENRSHYARPEDNPQFGRKRSPEAIANMRSARWGKK